MKFNPFRKVLKVTNELLQSLNPVVFLAKVMMFLVKLQYLGKVTVL